MHTAIPTFVGFAKAPWNKGRRIGQKRPLKPGDVRAIRVRLQLEGRKRDLALFNLAVDSKSATHPFDEGRRLAVPRDPLGRIGSGSIWCWHRLHPRPSPLAVAASPYSHYAYNRVHGR